MKADFWHDLWAQNDIGFHESAANDLLVAHFDRLGLPAGARVFVPLCGKTRDIGWLLSHGYHVIGAELSETAITQLFADLGVVPDIATQGPLTYFRAPMIDIFVGDIFDLKADHIGRVDAIYDRAALVALPDEMRSRYATLLHDITHKAPQIVICFAYDQTIMDGPPFSIDEIELTRLHGASYAMTACAHREAQVRGTPVTETCWHLQRPG